MVQELVCGVDSDPLDRAERGFGIVVHPRAFPARGVETAVSIRQHDIRLMTAPPAEGENIVPAKVVRQVFLGNSRDYMVEIGDGTQLRVVAPAELNIAPGAAVWLCLPPDRLRILVA